MRVSSHFHAQRNRTKLVPLPLPLVFIIHVILLHYDDIEEQKYDEMVENFSL
jgi:hypothetical protein